MKRLFAFVLLVALAGVVSAQNWPFPRFHHQDFKLWPPDLLKSNVLAGADINLTKDGDGRLTVGWQDTFANFIWVDNDSGDDSTGLLGRQDKPFKTLGQAVSNAVNDTMIFVAPTIEYVRASFHTGGYAGTLEAPVNFDKLTNVAVLAYGYQMDSTNTIGEFINIRECDRIGLYGMTLQSTNALRGGVGPEPDQSAHTGDNWGAINFFVKNSNLKIVDVNLWHHTRQGICHLFNARTTTNVLIHGVNAYNIGSTNVAGAFDGAFISGIGHDWTIRDCTMVDGLRAVEWQRTAGDVVRGVRVSDCRFYNVWREGLVFLGSPYRDVVIENTIVEMQAGALVGGLSRNVSFSHGTRDVVLRNCTFRGSDGVNEYMISASANVTNVVVEGCLFEDATGGGMNFGSTSARGIFVVNNRFKNLASRAIGTMARNILIRGNYFYNVGTNNSREPIFLFQGSTNVFITENIFDRESGVSGSGYAINVQNANIEWVKAWDNYISPNYGNGPIQWGSTAATVQWEHMVPGVTNLSGTSPTLDWEGPTTARLQLSGTTTLSVANTPTGQHDARTMYLTVGNPSSHSLTWPSAWRWGGAAPAVPANQTNSYLIQWTGTETIVID